MNNNNIKNNFLTNKELKKKEQIATEYGIKCPNCGHSILITNKYKRVICNWCGKYAYASEEDKIKYEGQEFVYRMKGLLKNDKK